MLIGRMNGFHGTVILDLSPSRLLRRAMWLAHGAVFCTLLLAHPFTWQRNVLLLALAVHLWMALRAAREAPIARLELDARARWHVSFCDGRGLAAELESAPWVSPFFTTVNLRCADGLRRQVVLLPDMVDADGFRRLRVRLRREGAGVTGNR